MNLFKDHIVSHKQDYGYLYITINRHFTSYASFRVEGVDRCSYIMIQYNAKWDTYAPLIVEYVINTWKVNNIYLDIPHGN